MKRVKAIVCGLLLLCVSAIQASENSALPSAIAPSTALPSPSAVASSAALPLLSSAVPASGSLATQPSSYLTILNSIFIVGQSIPHVWNVIKPVGNTVWDIVLSMYQKYKHSQKSDIQRFLEEHNEISAMAQQSLVQVCHNLNRQIDTSLADPHIDTAIKALLYHHTPKQDEVFEWSFPDLTMHLSHVTPREFLYFEQLKDVMRPEYERVFLNLMRPHMYYGMSENGMERLKTSLISERSMGSIQFHALKKEEGDADDAPQKLMVLFGRLVQRDDHPVFQPSLRMIVTPRHTQNISPEGGISHDLLDNRSTPYAPPKNHNLNTLPGDDREGL